MLAPWAGDPASLIPHWLDESEDALAVSQGSSEAHEKEQAEGVHGLLGLI